MDHKRLVELLEDALLDPRRTDFNELRRVQLALWDRAVFVEDPEFPYLRSLVLGGAWEVVVDMAERLLEAEPFCMSMRLTYARALEATGDRHEAALQRSFVNGLLRAVLRSGTGDERRPLYVVNAREQAVVLDALKARARASRVERREDGWFEVVTTEEGRELCFVVLQPHSWWLTRL